MEEKKVAHDSDLRKRAELLVRCLVPKTCEVGCHECIGLVFRELVAVRDQAAKYTTAEEWKRMHEEMSND